MQTWYYSHKGERQGPVAFDALQALAQRGELDPHQDLVWTAGMQDWAPSGTVPGLFPTAASPDAPSPDSGSLLAPRADAAPLPEIAPGSQPLDIIGCLQRAIALTKRHFGQIIGIGIVYWIASSAVLIGAEYLHEPIKTPVLLLGTVISMFFNLGLTRVCFNIIAGEAASVSQLFGEGSKLLRSLGAFLLYFAMVSLGFALFILPGIYLALRFGLFQYAIVDRNLGIMESLRYSSALTANNRLSLFGMGILTTLIILAGALALVVGLIFAIPVVTLAIPLAYRFLQFGPGALQDQPGTARPRLRRIS